MWRKHKNAATGRPLVLGGVMALSMLTACGSSDTDSVAAAVAETATSRTDIVDYAIEELEALSTLNVNLSYTTTLKGNESDDLASAVKALENGLGGTWADPKNAIEIGVYTDLQYSSIEKTGKSYVLVLKKDDLYTDYELGMYLAEVIAYHTSVDVKSMSVFEADLDLATGTSGSVSGTSVSGASTDEYWVIVITTE